VTRFYGTPSLDLNPSAAPVLHRLLLAAARREGGVVDLHNPAVAALAARMDPTTQGSTDLVDSSPHVSQLEEAQVHSTTTSPHPRTGPLRPISRSRKPATRSVGGRT
jgi:hypothetical protein